MVQPKRERAWAVIRNMPPNKWIDVKELASQAGLRPIEMARYLIELKKKGVLESRRAHIRNGQTTIGLWKKKAGETGCPPQQRSNAPICMSKRPSQREAGLRATPRGRTRPQTRKEKGGKRG